ncbi:MAG: M48 family metalloprotease [Acidobacteriota bacterium]|nr:M48 family metalloprotease [Acidobacteriota bacterium]MDH3785731.1 M48 family metalloprotease [Acidobacteriota bacterium]
MRHLSLPAIESLLIAGLLLTTGCAVNPATGKRQLMLVSDSQERSLGLDSDRQIQSQMGVYDDTSLQQYVSTIGRRMAAGSERPALDWTFRVIDDPVVNAFALPGGYIYVTRGILAHMENEAELAAVIGHEIGHVTARHGASQMSKAQLAQGGLMAGAVLAPEKFEKFGGLASQGMSLMFLKFGRDDERQADDLGLRYMVTDGYDADPMTNMFDMLDRIGKASQTDRLPGWISTHPAPTSRRERSEARIAGLGAGAADGRVGRGPFLDRIEGLVFGVDPREGFFEGAKFLHPGMRFRFEFPSGWVTQNQRQAVIGINSEKNAVIELTIVDAPNASEALATFLGPEGIQAQGQRMGSISGLPTSGDSFVVKDETREIRGRVGFVEYRDRVFRLLAYTTGERWANAQSTLRRSLASFGPLSDPAALNAQPQRLAIVTVDRAMTVESFADRYDATVDPGTLALINRLDPGERLKSGGRYKVVRGGRRP